MFEIIFFKEDRLREVFIHLLELHGMHFENLSLETKSCEKEIIFFCKQLMDFCLVFPAAWEDNS
jgi:hypothetical protein